MKKFKNNKGISLVSLTIAVIILVVLTSMLVYNAKNGIKLRTLKMMQNDIDLLSNEISAYYVKYGDVPAEIEYLGPINFEKQPNDDDKYYVIDLSAFEDITLNYGLDYNNITSSADTVNLTDVYIVNKQSMHVYYAKGIEMDGVMYYTNDEDEEIKLIGDRTGLKVGDYVDYKPTLNTEGYTADKLTEAITGSTSNTSTITQDQQYTTETRTGMTWQILRIYDNGSIDLIGSPTSQDVYFKGADGYNNGVTVMNDICEELYSNESLNVKARSVRYEDLEYWLTDAGKTVRDAYSYYDGGPTYGHTQTYTSSIYRYYPNLYAQEKGTKIDSGLSGLTEGIDKEQGNATGLGISDKGTASGSTQASTSLTVTQTFWGGSNIVTSENFGEGANVLKTTNNYWVASRCANCGPEGAYFGLYYVYYGYTSDINGTRLFHSYSGTLGYYNRLRPVVSLPSSVQIENCTEPNSVDNMHKIQY